MHYDKLRTMRTWVISTIPAIAFFLIFYGVSKVVFCNTLNMKAGYDIVPVYSEDGKLQGFTHPVLVDVADKYREKNNA